MKNLCFLLLMVMSSATYAQSGTVTLYINLKYDDDTPYANTRVYLKNMSDQTVEELRSDSRGKLKYRVATKTTYELQLKKDQIFATIKVPKKGRAFITENFTVPKKDYPTYPSDSIYQNINPRTDLPSASYGIVEIFIGDSDQKPIRQFEMRLFNQKTGKTYITKTTNTGTAYFKVPNNASYDVGLETLNQYKTVKVPNKPDVYVRTGFLFVPTNVNETLANDTIRQDLPANAAATSTRALVHILVQNYDDEPLANEQVALNPRGDSLTYLGYTNERGIVEFLLPAGKQYILHFYYERDIDLLDYRKKGGLHRTKIQYKYAGTEAIQAYFENSERDNFGFLKEFREVEIEPFDFKETDYIEKTENGYNINFKEDKGSINTPTVINGKIYTNAGYFSRNLYVFDEKTGKFLWGVALSEGGPSSIVYENGVLLLITESCTLYAIDANNGKLLWSKYLSPYMYSTPSVANGKVVATYPNGLNLEEDFVLGCFDLKTGKIEWQKSIDAEAISAPVIYNDKIFTATTKGSLYQHDLQKGERLQMDSIQAVTPPTIVDNALYIGIFKNGKEQHLIRLAADDFQQKTALSGLSSSFKRPKGAFDRMSFDGIRPLHKAGKNYLTTDKHLVCSDESGKIIWKSPLNGASKATSKHTIMPVLTNNTIITTKGSYIQLFKADTGELIQDYQIEGEALTQPTVQNGIIYSGSHEQRVITIKTDDKTLSGWSMWGVDGSHNAVVE